MKDEAIIRLALPDGSKFEARNASARLETPRMSAAVEWLTHERGAARASRALPQLHTASESLSMQAEAQLFDAS
jgi:hypothetical protein